MKKRNDIELLFDQIEYISNERFHTHKYTRLVYFNSICDTILRNVLFAINKIRDMLSPKFLVISKHKFNRLNMMNA